MPLSITDAEWFDIDGTPFATTQHNAPWLCTDTTPLWDGPDIRGDDQQLSQATGARPDLRYGSASVRSLPLHIGGSRDIDGGFHAGTVNTVRAQMLANVKYLRTHVVDPLMTGDGTRYLTLHQPDGSTWGGYVHVLSPLHLTAAGPAACDAVLSVSIVDGALEELGS